MQILVLERCFPCSRESVACMRGRTLQLTITAPDQPEYRRPCICCIRLQKTVPAEDVTLILQQYSWANSTGVHYLAIATSCHLKHRLGDIAAHGLPAYEQMHHQLPKQSSATNVMITLPKMCRLHLGRAWPALLSISSFTCMLQHAGECMPPASKSPQPLKLAMVHAVNCMPTATTTQPLLVRTTASPGPGKAQTLGHTVVTPRPKTQHHTVVTPRHVPGYQLVSASETAGTSQPGFCLGRTACSSPTRSSSH